ncbi:MAG: SWIM zinc finger family protein, partial [Candidatus Entotheonellia bacterium]
RVSGTYGVYAVSLSIDGSNLTPSCTCPADMEFCKHAVALGLTYLEEPESFYDLRTLTAQLEQRSPEELIDLIVQIATRHPQVLGMLGVAGFAEEEEDDDEDEEEELFDEDEDELDDEEDELDEDEEELEDEEDEEKAAGAIDVEAVYKEADILLDEFQDFLKGHGVKREDRDRFDETLQLFVDDYLAAYEVGKLTDMDRDEIDAYVRDYLHERERTPKRRIADTKQALCSFYTFLRDRGHISPELADPIIQYCHR